MTAPAPGSALTVSLLSPLVGGHLQTWLGEQRQMWRVEDPAAMASFLASGQVARTDLGEGQYREVGLLDADEGILVLAARHPGERGLPGQIFRLHPVPQPEVTKDDAVADLVGVLERGMLTAFDEQGSLLVSLGGWDGPPAPWVHLFPHPDSAGELVVQASPQPHGGQLWQPHLREGSDVAGAVLDRGEEGRRAAVILAVDAISTWSVGPWQLVLTYRRPGTVTRSRDGSEVGR